MWSSIIFWTWRKKSRIFKHFQSFLTLKIFWLKIFWLYDFIDFEKFFNFENLFRLSIFFFGTFLTGKFFLLWIYFLLCNFLTLDFFTMKYFLTIKFFLTLKFFNSKNSSDWILRKFSDWKNFNFEFFFQLWTFFDSGKCFRLWKMFSTLENVFDSGKCFRQGKIWLFHVITLSNSQKMLYFPTIFFIYVFVTLPTVKTSFQ